MDEWKGTSIPVKGIVAAPRIRGMGLGMDSAAVRARVMLWWRRVEEGFGCGSFGGVISFRQQVRRSGVDWASSLRTEVRVWMLRSWRVG